MDLVKIKNNNEYPPKLKKLIIDDYIKTISSKRLPKYKESVQRFINENHREPTALDYDSVEYLPSSRTLQRNFGGLSKFRELIGLKTKNFTTGKARAKKAKQSMDDCLEDETRLFKLLQEKYSRKNVSSPVRIFSNRGYTADIRIDMDEENTIYLVDIFKPNTVHSFKGCIRMKNRKYLLDEEISFTRDKGEKIQFLYVCVNEAVMVPVKNPIPVISLRQFEEKFLSPSNV